MFDNGSLAALGALHRQFCEFEYKHNRHLLWRCRWQIAHRNLVCMCAVALQLNGPWPGLLKQTANAAAWLRRRMLAGFKFHSTRRSASANSKRSPSASGIQVWEREADWRLQRKADSARAAIEVGPVSIYALSRIRILRIADPRAC